MSLTQVDLDRIREAHMGRLYIMNDIEFHAELRKARKALAQATSPKLIEFYAWLVGNYAGKIFANREAGAREVYFITSKY